MCSVYTLLNLDILQWHQNERDKYVVRDLLISHAHHLYFQISEISGFYPSFYHLHHSLVELFLSAFFFNLQSRSWYGTTLISLAWDIELVCCHLLWNVFFFNLCLVCAHIMQHTKPVWLTNCYINSSINEHTHNSLLNICEHTQIFLNICDSSLNIVSLNCLYIWDIARRRNYIYS